MADHRVVRPLPTPEHARQDDYNRRVPSQQQPRYDPTGYTSSGRSYPSAGSGGNAGVSGSGGRAQGREGSSSSSITSPAYGPPRPHSPLPPVPSSSYQTMPSAPPRTPPPSFPSSSSSTQPLPPGTSCFATKDHEVFQLIDLSGLRNAAAIRESVFAKLQIEDDAFAACDVFRTKMKAGRPLGARLSDTELWDACQRGEECTLYVRVDQRAVSTPTWAPGVDSAASSTAEFNREDRSSTIPSEHRHFVPPPYPEVQAPSSYAASRRAPSISSPSDTSNPNHISPVRETGPLVGEFGEPRGCGQSWNWGSGGSSAGQRQSGGGGDGIGLSPPMERGREREWDVRQSHLPSPDDFGRAETRSSVSTVQQQHYSPQLKHQASSQSMIMLPTGPVRRLPAPQEANEPPSRQRTQTSPGSPMPPNPPSTSTWAVRPPQPPLPSPSIRPLPSAFVSQSSQPPYPPYHNLHVQGLQSTFQQNQPTPPMPPLSPVPPHQNGSHNPNFPESARTVNFAKSAGNLREHYKIAFESDIRPNVQYTSPAGGRVLYPPARPQPPRLPPLSYPSSHSSQSQQQRPPPPQPSQLSFPSSPAPFDPRVMRPSPSVQGSSHVPPLTPQRPTTASGAYPSLWQQQSQHPPPTRRSPSDSADSSSHYSIPASMRVGGATAGQRWPNPHPDTTGSISLLPGQVLQQQSGYLQNRRTSEHSERGDAQLPQVARAAGFETERRRETGDDEVRWETSSQDRGERRGSGGSVRDTERERERILPRSLYPGGQRDPHPRDSGSSASSFGAPASWRAHPAPSAPPADEGDPYGGLDDGIYPSSGSPPSSSSARSSTSTGPLTPASAKVPFVPGQDWKSSSTGLTIDVGHTQDDGESTLQARDWSEVVAKVFTPDTEVSVNTFIPSPSPGETTITSAASTPTPLLNHFSTPYVDDDDEDEETATFIKGFGPARPIAPTSTSTAASPTRVALHDIPSSRSLTSNRSRPTLHVEIKDTPPPVARYRFSSPHTSPLREVSSRSSPDVETSPPEDRRSASRVTGLSRSTRTGELNQLGHSPLARSGSFLERAKHETDWAPRPKVEDVLENLEVFFPKHDLDKNVFDAPATAAVTPSPKTDVAAMIPMRHVGAGGGLTYKKSIKVVARDRKRNMLRASQRVQQQQHDPRMAASVLRRKSTKLFGSRVEEVTPAQMSQMEETIAESAPPDDPSNFSFKWIKGEMIGRGSYGKVYIAFNVTAGEAIAVKQVELPRTASDKEDARLQGMVSSLKAEIELLKDLSHDNIVEYLGMEETVDYLSIFLEYVPGGSVGRIIRTYGKFPEDVIKDFTFQIVQGLKYLHELGILHRDLKGDNILCDHDGNCKISDFGTSKRSQDIYNNNVDMSMQGSIFWMAPEVIRNERKGYSAKADIWSLGCLCLEMFAGRRPWDQNEMMQTMFMLGQDRLAPPIPEDVVLSKLGTAFFAACFQADPDHRPQARQLERNLFLKLPDDYVFTNTELYRAIAKGRTPPAPKPFQSPE